MLYAPSALALDWCSMLAPGFNVAAVVPGAAAVDDQCARVRFLHSIPGACTSRDLCKEQR